MKTVLALLLAAAPALAQEPDLETRLNTCIAGLDPDAIGARAEAFTAAHDYEARIAGLCAAGDEAGALALTKDLEAAFYAGDAEAARFRACIVEVLGEEAVATETVCDE